MKMCVIGIFCGVVIGGAGFVAGTWADSAATTPATAPAAVDVKNTKCIVAQDDVGDSKETVTYEGKIYHFCCEDCVVKFKKEPEKYVKAFNEYPGKYGAK
jgi:YHS domain-containing protein